MNKNVKSTEKFWSDSSNILIYALTLQYCAGLHVLFANLFR